MNSGRTSGKFLAFAAALMFNIQSIDTMKDSRDMARSMIRNDAYLQIIDREMSIIAGTGANYVAIDVPYDEEFVPMLSRWLDSARSHGLKVWFRGNLSGWEGWFGYAKIGREDHLKGVENFILTHPGLFRNGDIFSACPECENGGPGDPRSTGDVASYRDFLINEYEVHSRDFEKIGKKVTLLSSMNADVARLVMDKKTTEALGGVVSIDDYRHSAAELESDILDIHDKSGGMIVLGEFGGPIPDLNGSLDEDGQASYIDSILRVLYARSDIIEGVNYWTLRFGSTALLRDDLSRKPVVETLWTYYSAPSVSGRLSDDLGSPIQNTAFVADVIPNGPGEDLSFPFWTGDDGSYRISVPIGYETVRFSDIAGEYPTTTLASTRTIGTGPHDIELSPLHPSMWHLFRKFIGI